MRFPLSELRRRRAAAICAVAMGATAWSGCASRPAAVVCAPREISAALSPVPERATVGEAWRRAEVEAAARGDCEVVVGCGDSMRPLYTDRTVLVVRRMAMAELRAGMTVVFTGDEGRAVAHTLIEKTPLGWRAMGVGNRVPDRTLVRYANLVGVVVKAYATAAGAGAVVAQGNSIATGAALLADD